jgi:ribonuclease P protein component
LDGRVAARTAHFALHVLPLEVIVNQDDQRPLFVPGCTWVGAMAPKRWAKRAVTRNAIKRQVYAVCQDYESQLKPAAHVVRLRSGFDRKQYISASSPLLKQAIRQELIDLFDRLVRTQAKAAT